MQLTPQNLSTNDHPGKPRVWHQHKATSTT